MAFGIIMLVLASLCTYFYLEYKKNPNRRLESNPAMEGLANRLKKQVEEKKQIDKQPESTGPTLNALAKLEVGDYLLMRDVGLHMLNIEGTISAKHLIKSGSERISSFEVECGGSTYPALVCGYGKHEGIFVTTASPELKTLQATEEEFEGLNTNSLEQISFQGSDYHLKTKSSLSFCREQNELASEPRLEWWYTEKTGESHLFIHRNADQSVTAQFCVQVPISQCEWTRIHSPS